MRAARIGVRARAQKHVRCWGAPRDSDTTLRCAGLQAVALECMRGAHRQQRACYLYAFSGPGDVQELELTTSAPSLTQLLAFLRNRRVPNEALPSW